MGCAARANNTISFTRENQKTIPSKGTVRLNGVKVAAIDVGEMPGLQSVSG